MREESRVYNFAWKNSPSEKLEGLGTIKEKWLVKKMTSASQSGTLRRGIIPSWLPRTTSEALTAGCTPCHFLSSPSQLKINVYTVLSVPRPPHRLVFFLTLSLLSLLVPVVAPFSPWFPGFPPLGSDSCIPKGMIFGGRAGGFFPP